jgi:hypothetical protein
VLREAYLALRNASQDRPLAELEPSGRGDAQIARTKGVWVLWMVRQAVGPLEFRELWSGTGGPPVTMEALRESLAGSAGVSPVHAARMAALPGTPDWTGFFDFWVYSTGLPQYRLLSATVKGAAGDFVVTLKVANRGTGLIPAPLVVQTEEGARHEFSLSVPGGKESEVRYSMVTKPVAAAVDPEGDLLQAEVSGAWQLVKTRRWF